MGRQRLQKILAEAGVASRRASEALILSGRVQVNGQVVATLGAKADPTLDVIAVDGELIGGPSRKRYYLLHKPRGIVSTCHDPQGRPTVLDLLPGLGERVYPVGRLDQDSEGLVFLTNDGDVALVFTHPRYQVEKRYLAEVEGHPTAKTLGRLGEGVELDDGKTNPATVKVVQRLPASSLLEFTIHEGKNRQIRRMCGAVGHPVRSLKRFQMGPFTLQDLALGDHRPLQSKEITALKAFIRQRKAARCR